ncbi:MAG: 2-oxoacid:acceptor oxidoreductase subunit alpha [Candidatus Thorarchaeota archaeon]|nr:MAG: 2-oxoacid:acceptor oxidoreductase subunit alpha [Candidatus Thorarchaeota archaeon]
MSPEGTRIDFWQGNQACAEAAIAAGCTFFAGYPITPASEIAEIMASRLPRVGGTYLQMEDEIAAISAVIGASWGGALSMTATSGPGFSLMQENIGYAIMTEAPCVIANVQRAGPSTGQATKAAQGDFMQAGWGTHGDHESIVLAPYSAQETYELTIRAFLLSEKLRHPVILLSDEIVAHSRERVMIDSNRDVGVKRRFARSGEPPYGGIDNGVSIMPRFGDGHDLLVTGSTHDELGFRRTADSETHNNLIRRITGKVQNERELLTDVVLSGPKSADWGVVSYGCTSRSVEEVMTNSSVDIRSLRLRTLWPFPDAELAEFARSVESLLVPELSLGQLSREVSRAVGGSVDVVSLTKIGGGRMIEPAEIVERITGSV